MLCSGEECVCSRAAVCPSCHGGYPWALQALPNQRTPASYQKPGKHCSPKHQENVVNVALRMTHVNVKEM